MQQEQNLETLESFEKFYASLDVSIPVPEFLLNLLLTGLLAFILNRIYVRYGSSLSNRKAFADNFLIIALTTMIIITIVKSSLALSLGLVGALSIVRFRTAIKEPEELAYIFLTIALGLGFGANQIVVTILGFLFVVFSLIVYKSFTKSDNGNNENLILTVSTKEPDSITSDKITQILIKYCSSVSLKRLDENNQLLDISFLVSYNNLKDFNTCKLALRELDKSITISYLDYKGLY